MREGFSSNWRYSQYSRGGATVRQYDSATKTSLSPKFDIKCLKDLPIT